jgi:hypothetical protein
VQEYRHTAVGIGREVVGEHFATGYRTETARGGGGGGAAGEGEGSGDEDGEDPVELQSGRQSCYQSVQSDVSPNIGQN